MLKIARPVYVSLLAAMALSGATAALAVDASSVTRVDQSRPTPVIYPPNAQAAGEQGVVIVNVFVSATGKPSKYNIAQSSGYDDLDNAALETVLNWHYLPAVRDGDAVSDWTKVNVVYKLPN